MSLNKQDALAVLHEGKTINVVGTDLLFTYDYHGILKQTTYGKRPEILWDRATGLPDKKFEIYQEPKKKKMVKFWKFFLSDDGRDSTAYYAEDFKQAYDHNGLGGADGTIPKGWLKTSCYIEVEVEE